MLLALIVGIVMKFTLYPVMTKVQRQPFAWKISGNRQFNRACLVVNLYVYCLSFTFISLTTLLSRPNFTRLVAPDASQSSLTHVMGYPPTNSCTLMSSPYPTGLSYLATIPPGKRLISGTSQTPTWSGRILGRQLHGV